MVEGSSETESCNGFATAQQPATGARKQQKQQIVEDRGMADLVLPSQIAPPESSTPYDMGLSVNKGCYELGPVSRLRSYQTPCYVAWAFSSTGTTT